MKHGWAYSITVFITMISVITGTYMLLAGSYEVTNEAGEERLLGQYQAAMTDAIAEAEAARNYLRQAAKYAISDALASYDASSGQFTNVAGGGEPVADAPSPCGSYLAPKWSNTTTFCPPKLGQESYTQFLTADLAAYTSNAPYPLPQSQYTFTVEQQGNRTVVRGSSNNSITVPITKTRTRVTGYEGSLNWPVPQPQLSSCYGKRSIGDGFHDGLDFTGEGQPVKPVANGTVVATCDGQQHSVYKTDHERVCDGLGNYVLIKHDGFHSRYSHLQAGLDVSEGDEVTIQTTIGNVGNTGYSTGPHLDLKIYTTNDFTSNAGDNPLCFYSNAAMADLTTTSSANSCYTTFGNPATFRRNQITCQGINFAAINTDEQPMVTGAVTAEPNTTDNLGQYELPATFTIDVNASLPGVDTSTNELVTWANETWKECTEDPESCMQAKIDTYNEEDKRRYNLSLLSGDYQCKQDHFYHKLVDTYQTCLDNGRSNCVCQTKLDEIDDPGQYRIKLVNNEIRMVEPRRDTYRLGASTTQFSTIPRYDAVNRSFIRFDKEKDETRVTYQAQVRDPTIETLYLYKPEKDRVVFVNDPGDKDTCKTQRDTFLVCAESRQQYELERDGQTVRDNRRFRFAMELQNEPPESDNVEADVNPVEEDKEDQVSTAQSALQAAGIVIGMPGLGQILNVLSNVLTQAQQAAFHVSVDVKNNEDIQGFEVSCQTGTPAGTVDTDSRDAYVSIDNPYVQTVQDQVRRVEDVYDYSVEKYSSVTRTLQRQGCEYVSLPSPDGAMEYAQKIDSYDVGDKHSFIVNQCGGDAIQQLAQAVSPNYCITLTPIDRDGNRGEPITKCEQLVSIQDRVLEAIAPELKNVKDRFMQVKQDVSDISTALRNQNYGDIINVAQDNLIDDLENKEIVNGMSYKMLENTVSDIQGRLTSDERIQALQDVYSTVQDKQAALNELIRDQRYHDTVVEELDNALSQARKREVVDHTLQRFNQLTERAKNDIADTFLNFAGSATIDDKLSILQATEQQDVTRYITNLAEKNRRYNALAEDQDVPPRSLNELGLTDDETHTVFNEILRGDRGIPAQRALMRSSLDYMTPDQVGTVYDTIMNIDYDRIVDDVKQQTVENLPDDVKQRVWDETVGQFNDGQIADLHDHLSQDFKQRLYNHYYDQYRGVVEDAVKQGREQLFNAAQCAPNPFDNI